MYKGEGGGSTRRSHPKGYGTSNVCSLELWPCDTNRMIQASIVYTKNIKLGFASKISILWLIWFKASNCLLATCLLTSFLHSAPSCATYSTLFYMFLAPVQGLSLVFRAVVTAILKWVLLEFQYQDPHCITRPYHVAFQNGGAGKFERVKRLTSKKPWWWMCNTKGSF